MTIRWQGTLMLQGIETSDHRIFDTVIWRDLPRPLRVQTEDFGAHDGAQPAGAIETVELLPDGRVWGTGIFSESESGQLAATWVTEGVLRAVSVDYVIVGPDPVIEWVDPATDEVVPLETIYGVIDQIDAAKIEGNDAEAQRLTEWVDSLFARERIAVAEIAAVTLLAVEAFPEAHIEVVADPAPIIASVAASAIDRFATLRLGEATTVNTTATLTLTAAAPARMRADWFQPLDLTRPTKWTIGDDGRISGHLFTWGSCHRSFTGRCETPERQTDFGDFHCGETCLDNGERIRTGVMTFADLHAGEGRGLTVAQLNRLMEDTGTQLGPVRLHADRFGVQCCGQVFDDVDPTACARALAGYPSGDWRKVAGSWRLFGLHVVNTPGHPMYEEADGEPVRMVASMAPVTGPLAEAAQAAASCGCGEPASCTCDTSTPSLSPLAAAALAHLDATHVEPVVEPPSAAERLAALMGANQ